MADDKSKIVYTKTLVAFSSEEIDELSNDFRKKHFCIASDTSAIMADGRIMFIQTIFYKP